jgi:3'(2'), 5'-bisphosphate nucleotidase
MPTSFQRELETACEAVALASRVCRRVQQTIAPEVMEKSDRSPVTVADFASQAVVCRALEQRFAGDPIVGEEESSGLADAFLDRIRGTLAAEGVDASADEICRWIDLGGASQYSGRFWTLDPIDGTKGFLRREQYAVSLALIVDGKIRVAVLGCPNLPVYGSADSDAGDRRNGPQTDGWGVLFWAVRGEGSWSRPLGIDAPATSVRVSCTDDPALARFCESVESSHSSHALSAQVAEALGMTQEPLRLDSQAKYAVVARGEADIYMRLPQRAEYKEKIWDHAGGVLVIEEAGGTVTDLLGRPLEFHHGVTLSANRGILATNGVLHGKVLAELKRHYPPRGRQEPGSG